MLTTAPLLAGGPLGLAAAMGKTSAEAYTPQANKAAAVIAPLGLLAGARATPFGAQLGERAALRQMFPTTEGLAGAEAFGPAVGRAVAGTVDPMNVLKLQAARAGGGIAAGTATNELTRQAQSFADTGEFSNPTLANLVADVGSNLVFTAPLLKSILGKHEEITPTVQDGKVISGTGTLKPTASMLQHVMDTTKAAQELRNQGYANEAAWRAARGQRVAQSHKQIFDALESGADPIPAVAQLKGHWDSMMPEQTTETGLSVMKSMSDDGNVRGISDDTFNKILAGVQGKYHDHFEADPEGSTAPELVNELTKRKFLPAFTPAEIEPIYNTALQQAMGDPEVAKIYAVNALYAAQQERLPAAREAMRNAPVAEGVSKSDFKVEKDGEKDADYISAIIQLYPHTKNAVAMEGDSQIPLTQAIYKRDSQLSEKMFDTKGSFQTANKAQYDAWRDAVLEVARTYDPTTRQGLYQAVANKPATPISIEDMVVKDVNGKYIFQPRIKREMERAGASAAVRDAIAFVDEWQQKPAHQMEEDITNVSNFEKFVAKRQQMIKADTGVDEQLVSDSDLNAEADSQGLSGAERIAYIEANKNEQPLLGEKAPVGSNTFYDVALHLMQKVDTASNVTLWNKYGGERLFGKGAKSPGKMDLFKQAVLARMEGEMDDTGKLTAAQKSFYEAWRANASQKSGEQAPLAKTWEEQRQQFRHAQRLYWGTGNPVSMPELFMNMLDDKPEFQKMLKGKVKKAGETAVLNPTSTYEYSDLTNPVTDMLRFAEKTAKSWGLDDYAAQRLAQRAAEHVAMFPELGGAGELVTDDPGFHAVHLSGGDVEQQLGGPAIAINVQNIKSKEPHLVKRQLEFLYRLSHELGHFNFADVNSPWAKQRNDAHDVAIALITHLGPDGTARLLRDVRDVMIPPNLQSKFEISLKDASGNFSPEEGFARIMEYTMIGAMARQSGWAGQQREIKSTEEALTWLPNEITAVYGLAFRDLNNLMKPLVSKYKDAPKTETNKAIMSSLRMLLGATDTYLGATSQRIAEATATVQHVRTLVTNAGEAMANIGDPAILHMVNAQDKGLDQVFARREEIDSAPLEAAQEMMFGKPQYEHRVKQGTTVPAWSRWMGLTYQAIRRYDKAGVDSKVAWDAMQVINDLEKSYFRLTRQMHDPFMFNTPDGRAQYDPENPVLKMLQGKTVEAKRARQTMSKLALWSNENKMSVSDPKAAGPVSEMVKHYSPATQQAILEGVQRLYQVYQNSADIAVHSQVDQVATRLAGVFQTIDNSMFHDAAFAQAKQATTLAMETISAQHVLEYAQKKTPLLVQQKAAELQQMQQQFAQWSGAQSPEIQGAVQSYLMGPDGLATKLIDLKNHFASRAGWFTSETRPGRYFITSKSPDGELSFTSARDKREVNQKFAALKAQGHEIFPVRDRNEHRDQQLFSAPDEVVNNFRELEEKNWKSFLAAMKTKLPPDALEYLNQLGYTPGEASAKYLDNKSVERYMQKRESLPGREDLDAYQVMLDYTERMAGSVARQSTRRQFDLIKNDPRIKNDVEFKQTLEEAMQSLMTPVDDKFVKARAAMTAYTLGLPNFIGPALEGTQSVASMLPMIIEDVGFSKGVSYYKNALINMVKYHNAGQAGESAQVLRRADTKANIDPRAMTKEEALTWMYHKANSEGAFQYGPVNSSTLSKDVGKAAEMAMGLGKTFPKTREELFTDPLYQASQISLWLYSNVSAQNNRIAFLHSVERFYDEGLRGSELYQRASANMNLLTFGGGKGNSLGYTRKLANPNTYGAVYTLETMQRYNLGLATQWMDMTANIMGRTELPMKERVRAAQAMSTAMAAMVALGGALAIPGMAIALAMMKATSGKDPKQALREMETHIAKGLGADDELAVTFANWAQNGALSNITGMDLSNRVAMNSVLGFNSYSGFDAADALGLPGGLVGKMWNGTKYVAQGNMVEAGKSFAPGSWAPYIDMAESKAKYGDVALRDKSNRMIMPLNRTEQVKYALGARPAKFRNFKEMQEAVRTSNEAFQATKDGKMDELSQELLKGNTQATIDFVRQLQKQDPTLNPATTTRAVIDRAVSATHPIDPLAQGAIGNEPALRQIGESFGQSVPRQSEIELLKAREQLNAKLGYLGGVPATSADVQKAQMIDQLVRTQGMQRGEALRMVELMEKIGMLK